MRMIIRSKTIFSAPSLRRLEEVETKKASYWLEKLFNQRKDKEKKDQNETDKKQSDSSTQISPDAQKTEEVVKEKGLEEAITKRAGKEEENRQAVEDMVSRSNRTLVKISSVFPFDFFPSSIIVEETRLTIIHRQLLSSQAQSVDLKNISNTLMDSSILFAQLTIVSNTFTENQIVINRLWKKDAVFIRRIIEGLRMFVEKDIDTTGYEVEELISKLKELSTTKMVL